MTVSRLWRCPRVCDASIRRRAYLTIAHRAGRHDPLVFSTMYCTSATSVPPSSASTQRDTSTLPAPITPPRTGPRLNAVSARVREVLRSSAFHPRSPCATRDAALDEVIHLILSSPAPTNVTSVESELHPLLCVRVLEELGCALWCPRQASGERGDSGGWLRRVRHYPTLLVGPSSSSSSSETKHGPGHGGSSAMNSHATRTVADSHALALLCERVTSPLLRLVLNVATAATPQPITVPVAVQRVMPIAFEWRCTLPVWPTPQCPPLAWIPLLLREAQSPAAADIDQASKESLQTSQGTLMMAAVPFAALAPHLVRRILAWVTVNRPREVRDDEDNASASTSTPPHTVPPHAISAALAEEWLAIIFRRVRQSENGVDDDALSQLVFWSGTVPLLSHPLVRAALTNVVPVSASGGVRVAVPFWNDDELRKLLLRLSVLREDHTSCTTPATTPIAFVEPVFVTESADVPDVQTRLRDSRDHMHSAMPLRFIHPLHDYVRLAATTLSSSTSPCAPRHVQLSFAGCIGVLGPVIDSLQQLRRASTCHWAYERRRLQPSQHDAQDTTAHLTLLPHKPRLHALKSTCELLLHNVRTQLAASDVANTATTVSEPTASSPSTQRTAALFEDAPLSQQEALLRRLCGTTRALVRVVMEEKHWSVTHEGAEGGALVAGGAPSVGVSSTMTPTSPRTDALGRVLRNAAHRVLEPALRAYYAASAFQAPPVQVVLADLELVFSSSAGYDDAVETHARGLLSRRRRAGAEWLGEALKERYDGLYEAMRSVDHVVGGQDTARRTALQLLRQQGQQTHDTAVEGIRLLAVADLLIPPPEPLLTDIACGASASAQDDSNATGGAAEKAILEMDLVLNTFFPLWHRAQQAQRALSAHPSTPTTAEAMQAAATASQARCLSLAVALWMTHHCVRLPELCGNARVLASWRSLESILTTQGTASPWTCVGLDALLPALQDEEDAMGAADKATTTPLLIFAPSASDSALCTFQRCGCGGDLLVAARHSLWATTEAFESMVANVQEASNTASDEPTWRWLGSAAAVKDALRALEETEERNDAQSTSTHFFLLPWSTLAWSRRPFCIYDEGGHAASGVEVFDKDLQRLLSYCRVRREKAHGQALAVVRLVTLPEELTVFREARYCDTTTVANRHIQITHPEVALEEAVLSLVRSSAQDMRGTRQEGGDAVPSHILLSDDVFSDEEDGLD